MSACEIPWPDLSGSDTDRRLTADERAWLPALRPWDEPALPIAEREGPLDVCQRACVYGTCRAPRTTMGCGGCCECLGGCQAEYERQQTAPHIWTGDSA